MDDYLEVRLSEGAGQNFVEVRGPGLSPAEWLANALQRQYFEDASGTVWVSRLIVSVSVVRRDRGGPGSQQPSQRAQD